MPLLPFVALLAAQASSPVDLDATWGRWIDNIHVYPELRGRGIGEHLIRATARYVAVEAKTVGLHLWVFEANQAALRLSSPWWGGRRTRFLANPSSQKCQHSSRLLA